MEAACAVIVDPEPVDAVFAELTAGLAPSCQRRDLRANALLYVRGLLMPGVAGNCWSLAEAVGLDRPYRLQHLLERASWDQDAARDAVRSFLVRHLGADGGVLIFDITDSVTAVVALAALRVSFRAVEYLFEYPVELACESISVLVVFPDMACGRGLVWVVVVLACMKTGPPV
jgi:hypothetical protein